MPNFIRHVMSNIVWDKDFQWELDANVCVMVKQTSQNIVVIVLPHTVGQTMVEDLEVNDIKPVHCNPEP